MEDFVSSELDNMHSFRVNMSNVNLKRKSKLNESNSYLNIPKVNAVEAGLFKSMNHRLHYSGARRDIAQHNVLA